MKAAVAKKKEETERQRQDNARKKAEATKPTL
jgi:hypothetical protein